jgi:hypothetical protein
MKGGLYPHVHVKTMNLCTSLIAPVLEAADLPYILSRCLRLLQRRHWKDRI